MEPVRSHRARIRVSLGFACLLAGAVQARAQSLVEVGAGWNYPAPAPGLDKYTSGYNVRVSLGHQLAPRVRVRFDAFVSWFDDSTQFFPPCPSPGCSRNYYNGSSAYVAGLTANWLFNVDARGMLYGIVGVGVYDVSAGGRPDEAAVGGSAGVGIAVPVGARLRLFVESRYHLLTDTRAGMRGIAPVTFGVRF